MPSQTRYPGELHACNCPQLWIDLWITPRWEGVRSPKPQPASPFFCSVPAIREHLGQSKRERVPRRWA